LGAGRRCQGVARAASGREEVVVSNDGSSSRLMSSGLADAQTRALMPRTHLQGPMIRIRDPRLQVRSPAEETSATTSSLPTTCIGSCLRSPLKSSSLRAAPGRWRIVHSVPS
jgi:hypothetical protein